MVLSCKEKVEYQDGGEGESDALEENLDGLRESEFGSVGEVRVRIICGQVDKRDDVGHGKGQDGGRKNEGVERPMLVLFSRLYSS